MKKTVFLITVILLIIGCASPPCYYQVKTLGLFDMTRGIMKIPTGSSFAVMSSNQARCPLFNNEIKYKVEKLLVHKGYYIHDAGFADYHLFFNYVIREGCTGYTKKLSVKIINAEDFRTDGKKEVVWSGYAINKGRCHHAGDVIDYQLVSLFDYLGKNTYTRKTIDIDVDDERVRELQSRPIPLPYK